MLVDDAKKKRNELTVEYIEDDMSVMSRAIETRMEINEHDYLFYTARSNSITFGRNVLGVKFRQCIVFTDLSHRNEPVLVMSGQQLAVSCLKHKRRC
ncbi:hypothetical protein TNCT_246291 [Trichonephila clavata]|uniref:Uncharacterized protein n=1 Tax=Trichonephila clavata TaxID=2740835 RepID=A0A8X6JDJ2_TRICU|nr:hypothetical protein TNCT_246291 [Trichonephila clavata]